MINVTCPHCGVNLQFDSLEPGEHVDCGACNKTFAAPLPKALPNEPWSLTSNKPFIMFIMMAVSCPLLLGFGGCLGYALSGVTAAKSELRRAKARLNETEAGLQNAERALRDALASQQKMAETAETMRVRLQDAQTKATEQEKRANRLEGELASQRPASAETPTKEPPGQEWSRVFRLSGTTDKTSESFHIPGDLARVSWSCQDTDSIGGFISLAVYREGKEFSIEDVTTDGAGADVTYIRTSPGNHYIEVTASGSRWEITVEVQN